MEPFIGQIIMFAGNFAPRDWAFCDGELLPISQNQSLYSILGTTYGGDGRTTFGLPDFRGRVPIGQGQGNGLTSRIMGEQIGIEDITLSTAQMPIHSHAAKTTISGSSVTAKLKASSEVGTTNVPLNNYLAKPSNIGLQSINMYDSSADIEMASDAIEIDLSAVTANTTTDDTGGNSAHNNIQPSLVMNYIICMNGVYPSRS
jgi:microcystin-dependent protein